MAKLYFTYGTMGSSKTLNLLAVAHNYEQNKQKIILVKPKLENRFGENIIKTRAGLEKMAHLTLARDELVPIEMLRDVKCILVDEAQFLSTKTIENLFEITSDFSIPVMCYGLRTDFKGNLFEGAKRLFELADSLVEIKNICSLCDGNRKASFNLRFINNVAVFEGEVIELGAEEKYLGVCKKCFLTAKRKASVSS